MFTFISLNDDITMEYIYAVLLMHHAGSDITEDVLSSVLNASGIKVDENRVEKLISVINEIGTDNLDNVIKEYMSKMTYSTAIEPVKVVSEEKSDETEKVEDDTDDEPQGLASLFG